MQVAWDQGGVMDLGVYDHFQKEGRFELGFRLLADLIISRRFDVIVFHMQSALPYLLFSLVIKKFNRINISYVYDMHDLHEKDRSSIRSLFRYYILAGMEKLCIASNVQVLTVSKGLAAVCMVRYHKRAKVVRNIKLGSTTQERSSKAADRPCDLRRLIYFGLLDPERLPITTIKSLSDGGFSLAVFGSFREGRDRNLEYEGEFENSVKNGLMEYFGKYSPSDMSFLSGRALSVMPFESADLNIRYCLPNKLFQSLWQRVPCLVSRGMIEARYLGKSLGGAIFSFKDDEDAAAAVTRAMNTPVNWGDVFKKLQELHDDARVAYTRILSDVNREV